MLKWIFWSLLAANALLFAYAQGYLGPTGGTEREPARLKNQIAPERMVRLTAVQAKLAADRAEAPAPLDTPAPAPDLIACVQTGPLSNGDARRFEARIAALNLAPRQARVDVPFQEVTSRLVFLPPNGGREGAQRRAAELKERGVANFFIMQGESPLRWAISLGVFKTDGAAQKLVAQLQAQGVRGVRVLERGPQVMRAAYQYRALLPAEQARLGAIADDYPNGVLRGCD